MFERVLRDEDSQALDGALDNILNDKVSIQDGLKSLATILGGVGLAVAENKGLLQTSNTAQDLLKITAVTGASLIGIGSAITNFCTKNLKD